MIKKQCQQCSKSYIITPEDKAFYEKMSVPEPKLCPECRDQRRLVWRNERSLYARACDLCKKPIISLYPADSPYTIYCYECYYSDKWNALDYAQEIDFARPFFEQFKELQLKVPRIYAFMVDNENCDYTNGTQQCKDCYMIFASDHNEDCFYSYGIFSSTSTVDSSNGKNNELAFETIGCTNCFNVRYSMDSHNCNSAAFLIDSKGSSDCFMSSGLRNQKFVWRNTQLTEAEFKEKWATIRWGSAQAIAKLQEEFSELKKKYAFKYYHGINNENFSGDYLERCSNTFNSFESYEVQDCKNITHGNKVKDCHDGYMMVDNCELGYEIVGSIASYNIKFVSAFYGGRDALYCDAVKQVENVFGCIGVQNVKYCIFNKQYSKDEYIQLRDRLIDHMKTTGEYGEFFPVFISPFAYNETAAQDVYPLAQAEVENNGWRWKGEVDRQVKYSQYRIPDHIETVKDDICDNFLTCTQCKRSYKIVKRELAFYRERVIPVPAMCFECRHKARLAQTNARALWRRQCMCTQPTHAHGQRQCPTEFETTYSEHNPALVYCEVCYEQERA